MAPMVKTSPASRRLLSVGALALPIAGAGALWLSSAPARSPVAVATTATAVPTAAAPVVQRCAWEPGQRASYAGSHLLDSSFHLDASPAIAQLAQGEVPEQKSHISTAWVLDMEVAEVDDGGFATAAMRFRSFRMKESEADEAVSVPGIEAPFLVRLSPQCGVEDFGRRSDQDLDTAFQQQQTIASFQWRHATDGQTRYDARERDSMGEFTAHYERREAGPLRRTRHSFDSLYGSHPRNEAPLGRASGPGQTIEVGSELWFASIEQDETLSLTLHGKPLATMALRGRIMHAPPPPTTVALADVKQPGWVWGWLLGSHHPRIEKDGGAKVDPGLARMSVSQMLEQYTRMLGGDDVNKYVDFLASWVRSNPQRLGELLSALRDRRFPEKYGHSAVFLALARAGTPEARAALLSITDGRGWSGADRKRAALALVEAGSLPETLEKTLRDGARREPDVYASVLGQAIRMQHDRDPAAAGRMRETLAGLLSGAGTSATQAQMLTAVRNSAEPGFVPQVQTFTRSADVDVRIDAYEALGSMPVGSTDGDFASALQGETDARARAAMVRAYASQATVQGGASPAVLAAAEAALGTESNGDVKGELVALVGDAALKNDPAARSALESAYRSELSRPDPERNATLLQQMSKYVGQKGKTKG